MLPADSERDSHWIDIVANLVMEAGILDETVERNLFDAFSSLPRNLFVDDAYSASMYDDVPIPIGYGQLLSRPSLLIRMASLVAPGRGKRILEVGCGSGYLAAALSLTGAHMFGIEIVGPLAQRTRKRLDQIGFPNVIVHRADGRYGWEEHAPYDAVIVSTPVEFVTGELLSQLVSPGGRLVAPIGNAEGDRLVLWEAGTQGLKQVPLEAIDFE